MIRIVISVDKSNDKSTENCYKSFTVDYVNISAADIAFELEKKVFEITHW